jgi:hypothetical protein
MTSVTSEPGCSRQVRGVAVVADPSPRGNATGGWYPYARSQSGTERPGDGIASSRCRRSDGSTIARTISTLHPGDDAQRQALHEPGVSAGLRNNADRAAWARQRCRRPLPLPQLHGARQDARAGDAGPAHKDERGERKAACRGCAEAGAGVLVNLRRVHEQEIARTRGATLPWGSSVAVARHRSRHHCDERDGCDSSVGIHRTAGREERSRPTRTAEADPPTNAIVNGARCHCRAPATRRERLLPGGRREDAGGQSNGGGRYRPRQPQPQTGRAEAPARPCGFRQTASPVRRANESDGCEATTSAVAGATSGPQPRHARILPG